MGADQNTRPASDRITRARLHGAASRHAGWRTPVGPARARALDELRDIAAGRQDLLAEVAGILLGAHGPSEAMYMHTRIAAHLVLDAAGLTEDDPSVQEWALVGRERAERSRLRPDPRPTS